jgi:hypothetical protein
MVSLDRVVYAGLGLSSSSFGARQSRTVWHTETECDRHSAAGMIIEQSAYGPLRAMGEVHGEGG